MINKKYFFIIGVENRGEEVADLLRRNGILITDATDKIYADSNMVMYNDNGRINYLLKQKELLSDKEFYINTLQVPIAMFSSKQEKWLKWHCPLKFIRKYLLDKENNKEHWYYRLFFKY